MHPELALEIAEARTHNLKGVSCRIPHGRVTVITGPSGAGKSSLAFDTVYAEAQRRFVESMSTYARQFLEQMERPPVREMRNIPPAIALEAHNTVRTARSTVGTMTEIHDVLRLLYAHVGDALCPEGHGVVSAAVPEEAARALAGGVAGERFSLVVRLPRPPRGADVKLRELIRQGYARRLEGGDVVRMSARDRWLRKLDPLPLVLGRFRAGGHTLGALTAAIEDAYRLAGGTVEAAAADGAVAHFSRSLVCRVCGAAVHRPTPALFSFNSPLGACSTCQGFGRIITIDRRRVVPDPSRSLEERPIAPWNTPANERFYTKLLAAAERRGLPLDVAWRDLPEADRRWVWSGRGDFTSLDRFFARLERRSYKMHVRVLLARYRAYDTCPSCDGRRLQPAASAVRLHGESLPDLSRRSIEELRRWLSERRWTDRQRGRAGHLLEELEERLTTLHRVGLDYLSLDRPGRTLSGGEAQRIQLAAALGSGLTSTLYVLDEPTIGLHPRDSERLLGLLRDLAARGNTVLVVEHDPTLIRGADHLVELGPAAGDHGGEVVAEGTLRSILGNRRSLTGRYLRDQGVGAPLAPAGGAAEPAGPPEAGPRLTIRGARAHNLRGFDVSWPSTALVVVTGVSGSGKSTLVENVLYGSYQRSRGTVDVEPGECDAIFGLEELEEVTLVDQRPIGRSTRSNPVTYVKAYDAIRRLFAETPEARRRGIGPGHFSFNTDRGRCPTCRGTGWTEVDMQFMASVRVVCEGCQGHRFKASTLAVTWHGRNISEVLELTIDSALEVFSGQRGFCRRLGCLIDVGLGYLRLGQPTSTLSGGEAQRLKLASFLRRSKGGGRRLFLFDEPTTGLHFADVDLLDRALRRLVENGHGVVVVEHNLELIRRADWIVDLGPGGGSAGGELLFSGSLEAFVEAGEGPTAEELRGYLRGHEAAIE